MIFFFKQRYSCGMVLCCLGEDSIRVLGLSRGVGEVHNRQCWSLHILGKVPSGDRKVKQNVRKVTNSVSKVPHSVRKVPHSVRKSSHSVRMVPISVSMVLPRVVLSLMTSTSSCLIYTSYAADVLLCLNPVCRSIITKTT